MTPSAAAGPARRGPGRRPGSEDTRATILAAARTAFAERGYTGTTVRAIASAADVDPALVHHYFGTKEGVFVAAMQLPVNPGDLLPAAFAGDPDLLGERLVRLLLGVWSAPETREPLLVLVRSAFATEQGAELMRGFVSETLLQRVSVGLGRPVDPVRVTAAASQLIGLAFTRYVLRVEPIASATDDEVVALVGPVVQSYLAG